MQRERTGKTVTISTAGGEHCKAFIPDPLPPDPPLNVDTALQEQIEAASFALGRLDSISTLLPDSSMFLYMYVRKEAVLSSQIEGTQASLSDLLRHESKAAPGGLVDDINEVSNYVSAMSHGLERLRSGFPLSLRLMREIHEILLRDVRGGEKQPGEFRRSQNWIGGSRPGNAIYVPPPPENITECMGQLERFLHNDPVRTPLLIKAALSHVQFESIHPFLDGNGRLGRLLITLLLCVEGALRDPTLYLSLYLKSNRKEYYELLQNVRAKGEWEEWMTFFLRGIEDTSTQAVQTARQLVDLFDADRRKIEDMAGRSAGSVVRIHYLLQQSPIVTIPQVAERASVSFPTAGSALRKLEKLGIVAQLPKIGRARQFYYAQYLKILSEGTEPIPK